MQHGSKGFYFASLFLPLAQRRAFWAMYAFCRITDDIVDRAAGLSHAELCARLDNWQATLVRAYNGEVQADNRAMLAWHHATRSFDIPLFPHQELIEGVRMDTLQNRYADFSDLRLYCYRVASTVGLMSTAAIGYSDPAALDYAVDLGIAMQLTNILRDIGEDGRSGRIYIPQNELAQYGYSEYDLLRGVMNDNFLELMRFQIARAHDYYRRAEAGIGYLSPNCQFAICMAAHLYEGILAAIERNNYNVFTRRAFVALPRKITSVGHIAYRRRFGDRARYRITTPHATADSGIIHSDSRASRFDSAADSGTPPISFAPGFSVSVDGGTRRVLAHPFVGKAEKEAK